MSQMKFVFHLQMKNLSLGEDEQFAKIMQVENFQQWVFN